MAYSKTTRGSTKNYRKAKKRSKLPRGTSARAQKKQIYTLSRRLSKLDSKTKEYLQFGLAVNQESIANPHYILEITNPSSYHRIFDATTQSHVGATQSFTWSSFALDYRVEAGTEWSPVDMTMYVVSLKPATARQVLAETSYMTSLTNEIDYFDWANTLGVPSGRSLLNLKRFNIHMTRRILTERKKQAAQLPTAQGGAAYNLANTDQSLTPINEVHRGFHKQKMHDRWVNSIGPWTDLALNEVKATSRFWVLLFNNNYSTDGEHPKFGATVIINGFEQ